MSHRMIPSLICVHLFVSLAMEGRLTGTDGEGEGEGKAETVMLPGGVPLEMVYIGSPPQLPANPVMIERGALEGLVLLPENLGVRRIQFETGISPTDLGLTRFGAGSTAIVGSVGIQP